MVNVAVTTVVGATLTEAPNFSKSLNLKTFQTQFRNLAEFAIFISRVTLTFIAMISVDKRFHHLTSTKIRLKCTVALKVNHSTGRRQRKVTVSEGEEEVDVGEEVDGEADEEGEEEEEHRHGGRKRKLGREERRRETKDLNPRFESQIRIKIILDVIGSLART